MNIPYKSKMTKVMGSTTGGYEVSQARDRTGSKGGQPTQTHDRPSLNCGGSQASLDGTLPRDTWMSYRL
jgi:hypothetical protein